MGWGEDGFPRGKLLFFNQQSTRYWSRLQCFPSGIRPNSCICHMLNILPISQQSCPLSSVHPFTPVPSILILLPVLWLYCISFFPLYLLSLVEWHFWPRFLKRLLCWDQCGTNSSLRRCALIREDSDQSDRDLRLTNGTSTVIYDNLRINGWPSVLTD